MTTLQHCPLLVCGATLAGIGAALAAGGEVLIVERSSTVGHEFIEAFNPGLTTADYVLSAFGERFRSELAERNLIGDNGIVHLPGLAPVLCRHLDLAQHIGVLFMTEIVEVKALASGYEVVLYNVSGFRTVIADRILDTTTCRLSDTANPHSSERLTLNAYLHGPANVPVSQPDDRSAIIAQGRFEEEHILKWRVPADCDWPKARQGLHDYWRLRPQQLSAWTIAAVAGVIESRVPPGPHPLSARWTWLPSAGFDSPLQALDQGYRLVREKGGGECEIVEAI
ncbi:hypothetical protein FE783_30620 [Paenibacillus mesophilus]|uniref:hypothetical protein n=1 Tax=Paenibacillus mesophilus TaxID=2582849 RepID=UPI00110E1BA1|nr:hypothetical protein [Paenibacillus mesophilus]TMV45027.1 hypothetical protein FE783_30620 [Paenibacillus mesophilus]